MRGYIHFIRAIKWSVMKQLNNINCSSECRSSVGRMGGEQDIILDDICITKGTVIHELMHTIGFWHEQSRTDRDDYIKVNLKNVHPRNLI